jgi:hypothetical protein
MGNAMLAGTLLSYIAGKLIDTIIGKGAGKLTDETWEKLKGDKPQKAFKEALGKAIQRYATSGTRFSIAQPLLDRDGPLTDPIVSDELAQVLHFDREPNYQKIGNRWRAAVESPPQWRDFTHEAELLVKYFREELMASEVFGPTFDRKSLIAINENAEISTETLRDLEEELVELRRTIDGRFGDLMRALGAAGSEVSNQVRDFTWYIQEKTLEFIGRKFVFDRVEAFMQNNPRGYFLIRGDPGIGKTALMAQYVKAQGCIHHFNNRPLGINRADAFLSNICAQIIAAYHLDYASLPEKATQDGDFLIRVLNEASAKLRPDEKIVLAVDALDEVEAVEKPSDSNILYLPTNLPKGVYILATSRNMDLPLRIDCEQETLFIRQDSQHNIEDIQEYIRAKTIRSGIQAYIVSQSIDPKRFIQYLVEKSQGNFMYLRYVLPEIERGAYRDLALDALPEGLMNYYKDHWRRMRGKDEESWFKYKLPIIVALTIVKEPVSIELIAAFSKVQERARIRAVLTEWAQFLYEEQIEYEDGSQKRYRFYHASFHDFVSSKEEVADEHVDLKAAHAQLADTLWEDLFGNEHV